MENNKIAGLEVERLREISLERFGKDDYEYIQKVAVMVATAHCAKVSYNNHGEGVDYKKDIKLHDILKENGHASPFEHCAKAMSEYEYATHFKGVSNYKNVEEVSLWTHGDTGWSRNFKGFIQYRELIEK